MAFGVGDIDLGLPRLGLPRLGLDAGSQARQPLPPDRRQSLGRELLDQGKGALGSALWALDLPGAQVRGLLAGKPGTSLTGRQLLEHHGITRRGDNGWGSWGAGLAADIASDPLTYATFGAKHALTGGGRALMKAGELQNWNRRALLEGFHGTESGLLRGGHSLSDVSHLRDMGRRIATPAQDALYQGATGQAIRPGARLAGLARVAVPFAPGVGASFGAGKLARGVAGSLDRAGSFLRFGNPIGRQVGSLLDWRVGRAKDRLSQEAIAQTVPMRKGLEGEARGHEYDVLSALDRLMRQHPDHEANLLRSARINAEGTSPLAFLGAARDPAELALFHGFLAGTKDIGDRIAGIGESQLEAGRRLGVSTRKSDDLFARYVPRQSESARLAGVGPQYDRRLILPTTSGSNIHREEVYRNLPGGTDRINDWMHRFAGNPDRDAVAHQVLRDIVADHAHVKGLAPDPNDLMHYEKRAKELATRLRQTNPGYAGQIGKTPFFSHDIAGDVARRGQQHARMLSSADALVHALAAGGKRIGEFPVGQEYTPLDEALKRLELYGHDTGPELVGAPRELYRRLAPKGAVNVEPLASGGAPYGLNQELGTWAIGRQDLDQLAHNYASWITPEEAIRPIKALDSFTNAFKALAYPTWPGSHTRNAVTALLNNMRTGTGLRDYAHQYRLMRGQLPEAVADAERRAQYGHARIFGEGGPNLELAGTQASAVLPSSRQWSSFTPGTNERGMGRLGPTGSFAGDVANLVGNEGLFQHGRDILAKARDWRGAPNPWGLSGVAGRERDVFAPVAAGRKVSTAIEDFFRGAQYHGLRRQGYSPEMAAGQVRRFHFDYKDLTPFESKWMRRIAPFYTFTRKNLPLQLETLATRPAAFSTPFKPAMVDRDKQEYVPEYLANNFVMPLGAQREDGTRRFVSSLGLPQEEAFREMSTWGGLPDITSTAMRYAGNLNPLIKGLLEQLADRQFYSGRKLSDLRPSNTASHLIGSTLGEEYARGPLAQAATQAIANTPLTRFATGLDKLMDTQGLNSHGRKPGWATALNLLTGARVTDVDLDAQQHFEQRNALESMLKGQPNVSRYQEFYVRPEDRKLLTPEETLQLRMLTGMQQAARRHVEQRRRTGNP